MTSSVAVAHRTNGHGPHHDHRPERIAAAAVPDGRAGQDRFRDADPWGRSRPVTVALHAADPVSKAGIEAAFVDRARVRLVAPDVEAAEVALLVIDRIDEPAVQTVRRLRRCEDQVVVIVVAHLDDRALLHAVEAGVAGLIRRADATPEGLLTAIRQAAEGGGTLPPDLVRRLMTHVGELHGEAQGPQGIHGHGLTDREVEVLRLVADGKGTAEIAGELSYSERTIKNVIQGVTARLHLNNRSHAVAYALRQGLI